MSTTQRISRRHRDFEIPTFECAPSLTSLKSRSRHLGAETGHKKSCGNAGQSSNQFFKAAKLGEWQKLNFVIRAMMVLTLMHVIKLRDGSPILKIVNVVFPTWR
jgi:hypothetical protein